MRNFNAEEKLKSQPKEKKKVFVFVSIFQMSRRFPQLISHRSEEIRFKRSVPLSYHFPSVIITTISEYDRALLESVLRYETLSFDTWQYLFRTMCPSGSWEA